MPADAKNFEFKNTTDWKGYNSSRDKTNLAENVLVRGSQNVYKKLSGTIANRPGLKRRGAADATISPDSSEYVWNTSWGATYVLTVAKGAVYAEYNGSKYAIYTTAMTRLVFDKWYDAGQSKDVVLFCDGTPDLKQWSGGITSIASGNNSAGAVAQIDSTATNAGSGYLVGDILTITTGGAGATAEVTAVGTGAILTAQPAGPAGTGWGGFNYVVGDVLQLTGGNLGSGGSVRVATLGTFGSIATVTIETSGIGYAAGFNYTTQGGSGYGSVINVQTVATSGSVTGVRLVFPGSGYTTGTGKVTTGGAGTGATLNIKTIATGSITKSDLTTTFSENGFASAGVIVIGGTEYTYQYNTGVSLVGVTPDPSSVTGIGYQKVVTYTNTPNRLLNAEFLKTINNQVHVGSYASRLCFISSAVDYTNYVVPAVRAAGDPELLTLDSTLKGIGVRQGNAHIAFGTDSWAVITFADITVGATLTQQTKVDVKPVAALQAAYAHEFIDTVGDTLVYLAQDQQVRTFGNFTNLFTPAYPSISQEISTELQEENFTGGGLRCIGELTYLTAPPSGKTYVYQVRESIDASGTVVAERLWYPPQIWNFTRVDEIDGKACGFSNSNPQEYQIWDTGQFYDDSPSDEALPYVSVAALSYRGGSRRQGMWSFDKAFSEGYMSPNTPLNLLMNYDYEGTTRKLTGIVNSIQQPAKFYGNGSPSSLGDSNLGDEPNGDETEDTDQPSDALPEFVSITPFNQVNCLKYQPVYSSDAVNSQWELLASGTNATVDTKEQVNFLINKARTA